MYVWMYGWMINHVRIRHWSLRWSEIVSTWDIKDEMKNTAVKNGALRSIAHTHTIYSKALDFCFPSVDDFHAHTGVHVSQYPVNELTEDLSGSLHRLLVLRRATAASINTERGLTWCWNVLSISAPTNSKVEEAANSVSLAENDPVTHLASSLRAGIIADISSPSMVSVTASVSCWEKTYSNHTVVDLQSNFNKRTFSPPNHPVMPFENFRSKLTSLLWYSSLRGSKTFLDLLSQKAHGSP